ncbi:MAG: hypothetical protein ABI162_03395 [Luteolibacter sp.]
MPLLLLLGGYLLWVATPFNDTIRVHNSAGIAERDVEQVIAYARSIGAYSQGTSTKLASESRWTPWKRGFLFIEIEGDTEHIKVQAGFFGGPLYGGGPTFEGDKTTDGWSFQRRGFWVS